MVSPFLSNVSLHFAFQTNLDQETQPKCLGFAWFQHKAALIEGLKLLMISALQTINWNNKLKIGSVSFEIQPGLAWNSAQLCQKAESESKQTWVSGKGWGPLGSLITWAAGRWEKDYSKDLALRTAPRWGWWLLVFGGSFFNVGILFQRQYSHINGRIKWRLSKC